MPLDLDDLHPKPKITAAELHHFVKVLVEQTGLLLGDGATDEQWLHAAATAWPDRSVDDINEGLYEFLGRPNP